MYASIVLYAQEIHKNEIAKTINNIDKIEYLYCPSKKQKQIVFSTINEKEIQHFKNLIKDSKKVNQCYCTSNYKIVLYSNNKIVDEFVVIEKECEIKNKQTSFKLKDFAKLKSWLDINCSLSIYTINKRNSYQIVAPSFLHLEF